MSVRVVKSFLVNFKGWPHVRSTTRCVAIKDVLYLLNDLIRIKHNMDMKEIMKVSGSFFCNQFNKSSRLIFDILHQFMGNFSINQIFFYFGEFLKKISPIVKISKNLGFKNLESNLGLMQIITLVVNTLITRTIREL